MNCLFVYNPVSGKGKTAKREGEIVRVLGEKFGQVDVYATQGPGEMTRVVRERAGGYSAIVFAGGDGTFNEVLQGVCESGADPILGYIPGGTVNDIAHSLHIPRNWKKALSVICGGHGERLDCMCANGKYAMYVVTAGAFTSATYSAPQTQKKRFGRLAYGFEGLRKNMHFDVFPVRVRGGEREIDAHTVLILFINGEYVAGMHCNRRGNLRDGMVECAVVRQKENPRFFAKVRALFTIARLFLFGYRHGGRNVLRVRGSHFEVETAGNVVWNFDGEKGMPGKIAVDVLPARVNVLVPAPRKNRRKAAGESGQESGESGGESAAE